MPLEEPPDLRREADGLDGVEPEALELRAPEALELHADDRRKDLRSTVVHISVYET